MAVYLPKKKTCAKEKRNKMWEEHHLKCVDSQDVFAEVVMYGDSNIAHYNKWHQKFGKRVLNFGFAGDCIEQCEYRLRYGRIPKYAQVVIVNIGSNNVGKDEDIKIAAGIKEVCEWIHLFREDVDIIACGVIPGKGRDIKKVKKINFELGNLLRGKNGRKLRTYYKAPNMKEWTIKGGKCGTKYIPNPELFQGDGIHLNDAGYDKLGSYLQDMSLQTCLPLIVPDDIVGCLEDPFKHLAIGMPEKITEGDEPPPLWNPRRAPINIPKYMPSYERIIGCPFLQGSSRSCLY